MRRGALGDNWVCERERKEVPKVAEPDACGVLVDGNHAVDGDWIPRCVHFDGPEVELERDVEVYEGRRRQESRGFGFHPDHGLLAVFGVVLDREVKVQGGGCGLDGDVYEGGMVPYRP